MKKFFTCAILFVFSCVYSVYAQQLPNADFEDWTGAAFNGNIQLASWKASNVEQTFMGITARANMITRTTDVHSGSYAALIKNTKCEVAGIGEVSPAWITLGTPFADISNGIDGATAGTYGGLNWTYRPDTMQVWIKRTYTKGTPNEIFSLVYYAWKGSSKATHYSSKSKGCVTIAEKIDEESDIRQATDANACGTTQFATQVSEGWHQEKAAYNEWTLVKVPITYYNDEVPEKMNIILSAGNYPNFRATTGINEGNALYVDDISMIYSSCAHELYINNKPYRTFSKDVLSYTISLGQGVTTVPQVFAKRSGRRLSSTEMHVVNGQVDGAPTTITITAEDGSSTTTYSVYFVSATSNNARLADIKVNGTSLPNFNAYLTSYTYALPYGTTVAPTLTATAEETSASVQITQAASPTGLATIAVTAQDGTTKQHYKVAFSISSLSDNTLQNILLDGVAIPGFQSQKTSYTISLPLGTTIAPVVTPVSAYPSGEQTINVLQNTLDNGCQIAVSSPGLSTPKTYRLTYKLEASSYSLLGGIMIDGMPLSGFEPSVTNYSLSLPLGTSSLPTITWLPGDAYQNIRFVDGGLNGISKIIVTAANGTETIYKLRFVVAQSSNCALAGISLNGEPLDIFDAEQTDYTISLPIGTTIAPAITFTAGDAYQTISLVEGGLNALSRIVVKAGDGTQRVYTLRFEVQKSESAFLRMIYLNGDSLHGFVSQQLDYQIILPSSVAPIITVDKEIEQKITITQPTTLGVATIEVQNGGTNTYRISFVNEEKAFPAFEPVVAPLSSNALLDNILVGGVALNAFNPTTYHYTDTLAWRTYNVPAIMPIAAERGQVITISYGAVNDSTRIHVVAADGITTADYVLFFPVPQSDNTALTDLMVEGADFAFDPEVLSYDILLPRGTTEIPAITPEKSLPEQRVEILTRGLNDSVLIIVTAENGAQRHYRLHLQVAQPTEANVLQNVTIDGYGLIDLTATEDSVFTIEMPYGTRYLKVVNYQKNYAEQTVFLEQGGAECATKLTVRAGRDGERDKVYLFKAQPVSADPAQLTAITIDGEPLATFSPAIYNYVLRVNDVPQVKFTAPEGSEVDVVENIKQVQISVANDVYSHVYTLSFFYPGDFTFSQDFEQWTSFTNPNVSNGNTGVIPAGWHTSLDAATSGDQRTYYPADNVKASATFSEGATAAELNTTYLLTSAEAMPGIISLSEQTVKVGAYWIITHTPSSVSFGDPIPFRNTPDRIAFDYNALAVNKIKGWRLIYKQNKKELFTYAGSFAPLNQWQTLSQDISYAEGNVPQSLDIIISAAHTENLSDFYVGAGGADSKKHFTSKLLIDNLRFYYNSTLQSVFVNNAEAQIVGNTITATIDPEFVGTPDVRFIGQVSDQGQQIEWAEWQDNTRHALIHNMAEDGSETLYELIVTRPLSTNTSAVCTLQNNDLHIARGSAYQQIAITHNDTAYLVNVTAESGAKAQYIVAVPDWKKVDTLHTAVIDAAMAFNGQSAGTLSDISIDELSIEAFAPTNYDYTTAQKGNYAAVRTYPLDTLTQLLTDSLVEWNVVGATSSTYRLHIARSNNAHLQNILLGDKSLAGFDEAISQYSIVVAEKVALQPVKADSLQRITQSEKAEGDSVFYSYIFVQAENGNSLTYCVKQTIKQPNANAQLADLRINGEPLADFTAEQTNYQITLPAGSPMLDITAFLAGENASVAIQTELTDAADTKVYTTSITITAEAGNMQTYTVVSTVLLSEENHLSMIYLNALPLADFNAETESYSLTLPHGTTELPAIDATAVDASANVQITVSSPLQNNEATMQITCTAANGSQRIYTLYFEVLKSANTQLKMLYLDDEAVANFDAEETDYQIALPYGSAYPVVTYALADSAATATITSTEKGDSLLIVVTAEDAVYTQSYAVSFKILPSTNALLTMLYLDGEPLLDFSPEEEDYTVELPYGTTVLPNITYQTADEQQRIAITDANPTTITVTAGDGETMQNYTITFTFALSCNNYLQDLRLKGTTIAGFNPDSLNYHLTFPIGTKPDQLFRSSDLTAIAEDADAIISISQEQENLITILVTAPCGDTRVYVIEQEILLSNNSLLDMIYLDDVEIRNFDSQTLEYELLLPQGALLPTITADAQDSLADILITIGVIGDTTYIYCEAEDGSETVYKLIFRYTEVNAGEKADIDDCMFLHIAGTDQYLAVTIRQNVKVVVCDHYGHRLYTADVPVVDPNYAQVETDAEGNQFIAEVYDGANGAIFTVPAHGKTYFAVFFCNGRKKVAKGYKFSLNM